MTNEGKNHPDLLGDEKLLPRSEWIPYEEMNSDWRILKHSMFENVFTNMVERHRKHKDVVFLSLCSKSRPYSKSLKWKRFTELFGERVELTAVSNGGIFPREFWNSYPCLSYDGYGFDPKATHLYQRLMRDRLTRFLESHRYKFILGNFRPRLRNAPVAKEVLYDLKLSGVVKDYAIIPDENLYRRVQSDGFGKPNGVGNRFPDLHLYVLNAIENKLREWGV